jgi:hypothetical protein
MMTKARAHEAWYHTLPMFLRWVVASWLFTAVIVWSVDQNKPLAVWLLPSWLVLGDIAMDVPDHRFGEDPDVSFFRDPWGDLQGRYATDVLRLGDRPGNEICRPSGSATYQDRPGENVFNGNLSDFLEGCPLPLSPGTYEMQQQRWLMVWGVEKAMPVHTVEFTIHP